MKLQDAIRPIWIVAGTRPEVIKLAPVYFQARKHFGDSAVQWISTGQHLELEDQMLSRFAIEPDHRLAVRKKTGSIVEVSQRAIRKLAKLQKKINPRMVIVQGDTVSTFSGAFAAFHGRIPVAHVEAGLRSGDIHDPYPEEAYRRMTSAMTDIHFAPTCNAASNLLAEGYSKDAIFCTGNTSIDAVAMVDDGRLLSPGGDRLNIPKQGRLIFVTMHRREAWGKPLEDMCRTVKDIVKKYPDVHVILPVHVNPKVSKSVTGILQDVERVQLTAPLDFLTCHEVIRRSYLILTDSGGIAEEAPSYGVPVLVLRKVTERPEAIEKGLALLTGTDPKTIFSAACRILDDPVEHARMSGRHNPYGDGRASDRIVLGIDRFLSGKRPILTREEEFR